MEHTAPLPEWSMYVILAAQGIIYTIAVVIIAKAKGRSAEAFLSGGRDIGHGMINASIVATWIWAATLMISSWTGFSYGFTGPWWYAAGATIPLPCMAYIGKQIKIIMPKATSYPEFVLFRSDKKNHLLHSIITIIVCLWVTLMIITGGGVMLHAFTGAPFWIIAVLMTIIFISYISFAGLWASIFADTVMCLVMYACLLIIVWTVVLKIGPSAIYEGLINIINTKPNLQPGAPIEVLEAQWDPLNWFNTAGLGFLIVNTIGNLGAVLCNQTYWSRMTGSKDPYIAWRSFMTAAFCWWPIPFATATALGVGGLSMGLTVGETYTSPTGVGMLFTEPTAIAPMTAFVVLGYLGLIMFVVAVGGATISTGAGEILAVVTVLVNDLYRGYINPKASDAKVLSLSRIFLVVTGIGLLAIVIYWRAIGFTFSGMYQAMGVAFSSAVIPIWMFCFYKNTNKNGAFWATIIGGIIGILYWVLVADMDLLWGVVWANLIVMGVSAVILIPWTMIAPQPFDFKSMKDKGFEYGSIDEMLVVTDDK